MTPWKSAIARLLLPSPLCIGLLLQSPSYAQDQTTTNNDFQITWTHRGIEQYQKGFTAGAVLPQADGSALILLPMPGDQIVPKTSAEWAKYGESMKGFFRAQINAARAAVLIV
jgi:hypothetical protein